MYNLQSVSVLALHKNAICITCLALMQPHATTLPYCWAVHSSGPDPSPHAGSPKGQISLLLAPLTKYCLSHLHLVFVHVFWQRLILELKLFGLFVLTSLL